MASKLDPLPKFDITLTVSRNPDTEEIYEDVRELVCKVKKGWEPDKLETKVRTLNNYFKTLYFYI